MTRTARNGEEGKFCSKSERSRAVGGNGRQKRRKRRDGDQSGISLVFWITRGERDGAVWVGAGEAMG